MMQALAAVLPLAWAMALTAHGLTLAVPQRDLRAFCRWSVWVLAGLQGAFLASAAAKLGHLPVTGFGLVLANLAAALLGLSLLLAFVTRTPRTTGVPVYAMGLLLQLLSSATVDLQAEPRADADSAFFVFHALAAIFALVASILSGLYGLLYVLLLRAIRAKRFGPFFQRMPDLSQLAALNRSAAGLGFVLMTLALNLGIWWAHAGAVEHLNYLSYEVWPALALWLVFGLVATSGWIGVLSARLAALISSYAALAFVLATIVLFLPFARIHGGG